MAGFSVFSVLKANVLQAINMIYEVANIVKSPYYRIMIQAGTARNSTSEEKQ